ncbi:MAG: heme-binding protein [Isosphaeraceae bacterium]
MRVLHSVVLGLASLAVSPALGDEPANPGKSTDATPASEAVRAQNPAVPFKPADGDSPLAEGWPGATRPGMIEVKSYPAYRSAVARAKQASMGADNVLFWPLFNHISKKGVEMTTPVVNTYEADMLGDARDSGDMSMEFVYRTTTLGETGQGVGAVKVEDHPEATYVCLGLQGAMSVKRLRDGVAELNRWLEERQSEWIAAGPPRRLGYHGPMTPTNQRLWEVQIPVKPAPR